MQRGSYATATKRRFAPGCENFVGKNRLLVDVVRCFVDEQAEISGVSENSAEAAFSTFRG